MNDSKKRVINAQQHNCAHCGTQGANYHNIKLVVVDDVKDKKLGLFCIQCSCCGKITTHLVKNLYEYARNFEYDGSSDYSGSFHWHGSNYYVTPTVALLDENIIMSIPTPTFIIDADIPHQLRNPLIEAGKCIKENALVGASACVRKAIYEFLSKEKAAGDNYDEKIKSIKSNWKHIEDYLDVLKGIKGVTSDQVHEDSFEAFSSEQIKSYVAILEEIFKEIYVIPKKRAERKEAIFAVFNSIKKDKEQTQNAKQPL